MMLLPRGDGTGPVGKGLTAHRRGGIRGKTAGPGGFCVCPKCGAQIPHQQGTPCTSASCPQCSAKMIRGK